LGNHKNNKTVCFIVNNPFVADNRVLREAKALVDNGFSVTVLATQGVNKSESSSPLQETIEGIQVHRIFEKELERFTPMSWFRQLKSVLKIRWQYKSFDCIHCHDADTLALGQKLAKVYQAKLVYDAHELWDSEYEQERLRLVKKLEDPQAPVSMRPKLSRKIMQVERAKAIEKEIIPTCDAIISVNQSLCNMMEKNTEVAQPDPSEINSEKTVSSAQKVQPIRNIPPLYKIPTQDAGQPGKFHEEFNIPKEFKIVLYQGGLSLNRGILQLIEAFGLLKRKDLALVLMGPCAKAFQTSLNRALETARLNTHPIYYKPPVYDPSFLSWTASADLGIHPLLNSEVNHYYCLPNKLFEYIQAEIPMAVSNFPEMAAIVNSANIGLTFNPENPQEIADCIEQYFNSPDLQATFKENLQLAKKEYCWEREQLQLVELYEALLK
jgi:glycosyltransferase involved in cell wall biosynthesis